ncbi:hypothetical protein K488DRAFT_79912 [Vararia minispora EC-137]|uniref:Uncharacterized protein n=1 Tax=Vararia minispora EC-137 TaxID=1314806 RepID=A0ACB8QE80_9AGAM|nr:hypothetical protein K488DRAFT_79912 [Vararia minispora EC-137]
MAPPNTSIQGLNIVHSAPAYASGPEPLHLPQGFPELAQLELWSHLAFQSDDAVTAALKPDAAGVAPGDKDEDEEDERARDGRPAAVESHENAVTGTPVPALPPKQQGAAHHQQNQQHEFDLGALLASFSQDPFSVPGSAPSPAQPHQSLAQILAFAPVPPTGASALSAPQTAPSSPTTSTSAASPPAAKRPRTRKASVSGSVAAADPETDGAPAGAAMSATEDKRRRNTAASARFRLKKKEREAALEKRARELEARVGELERECEGLRRENGWLKGLVVGVTGVGVAAAQPGTAGAKRVRED